MTRSHPRVGPLAARSTGAEVLDVDALLDDRRTGIIVCCGSGGVGKTTTSAALALRAAEQRAREQLAEADLPTLELPDLTDGIDVAALYDLAEALTDQGVRL